ncbi:DUF429 domain-containing protein [Labrys neptuniae]|uniref:DUF429 domain-containing protein n=1 Tax=Labrys neptuniae TaxID=376174 RepID=A0ABV3PIA9_9HYPH
MNAGDVNLLGIDVGFSKSRPTTGIAWSVEGSIGATKTHTEWERRKQHLPPAAGFSVIAIDGPLAPMGSPESLVRTCERLLARGLFQKRCKPGASHFGTGLQLKRAAHETANQIRHLAAAPLFANAVFPDVAIVEAFPNAFLGVLLSDQIFAANQIPRGKKFDWMYEKAIETRAFIRLMSAIGWGTPDLLQRVEAERDHEKRAAYICLMTAACATTGEAEIVGDGTSGWIWLPPAQVWAPWAREALEQNRIALPSRSHP